MGLAALVRFATLIALRRTASDWRVQGAAGFGMVLAVALMASGVIYSNALKETALEHTLRNVPDEELNLTVRAFHPLERRAFNATSRFVDDQVLGPLRPYITGSTLLIQTSALYLAGLPQLDLPDSERPRGSLQGITDLEDHARLVEGRFPRPASGEVEVVIDPLGASALGLKEDERFLAFSAIVGDQEEAVSTRVVGIIEPLDPSDQYWQIGPWDRSTSADRQWVALPMYADMDALFNTAGVALPNLHTDFVWLFVVDREGLRASEVEALRATLDGTITNLSTNLPNSTWDTELGQALQRYSALLVVAQIPLFLVLSLAVGVLLYYLFLIAGLMGRMRASEVALFRSRGATTPQVGVVILVEGVMMAVPAIAIGPFLAQALVQITGRLFPAVSGGSGLGFVDLSPPVFAFGAVGALLAVAVLTATTLTSSWRGMVSFRSSSARPPQTPVLHRYYIDLVVLAVMGMVWWQLQSRGSFFIQPLSGEEMKIDVTLLLGPVLGAVAAGLLLLRLFPLVMRTVGWIVEPFGPVWLVQALHRVARDPVPSGAILVLVALATSLGVLSSAIIATLERSQREQALYEAGADLRIRHTLGTQVAWGQSVAGAIAKVDGVLDTADVLRLETRASTATLGSQVTLFALEPDSFPRVAWSRSDFARGSLSQTLTPIAPDNDVPEGIPLPAGTSALGIWVQPGRLSGDTVLIARLQDGRGVYFDVLLGELAGQEWHYLEAPIEPASISRRRRAPPPPTVGPPYTLHTLWVATSRGGQTTGAVFLDQLQAVTPDGVVEVETFQDIEGWQPLEDSLAAGLYSLDTSEAAARPGRRSAVFTWGRGGQAVRGIRFGSPESPLPVLVSPSFLEKSQVRAGEELSVLLDGIFVPVQVAGTVGFFPTLDPRKTPFIIADLRSMLDYVALHATRPTYPGLEVWVRSSGGGVSSNSLRAVIQENGGSVPAAYEAAALVAERVADPLLTAGWSGLLALSFLSVVLASASGLLLYTYIDARERIGEFAVLRTLGFSRIQVNGVVWFNLALTVVLGAVIGTWGGQLLGIAILPLLEIAEGGARVTPPMVLENNWSALVAAYAVLAVTAGVTVVALAWAIGRLELQRILRVAEA